VAVSEFTKQDIAKTYGEPIQKIDVVYNDASDFFCPVPKLKQSKPPSVVARGSLILCLLAHSSPEKPGKPI
jgi:hypothetical protein